MIISDPTVERSVASGVQPGRWCRANILKV